MVAVRVIWLAGALSLIFAIPHARAEAPPPLVTAYQVAADFSPVLPTSTFPTGTRELFIAYRLGKDEAFKQLTATFVAVDTGGLAPPNYTIGQTSISNVKQYDRGAFHYSQPKDLPVGHYRVDVSGDGKPWHSVAYDVADTGASNPPPIEAKDMLPLATGTIWHYALTEEADKGVNLSLSGATRGADGKLHAEGTYRVADNQMIPGRHIEIRRGDELVAEEWWTVDSKGLAVTQRKTKDGTAVLKPPQVIWHRPEHRRQTWAWQTPDKVRQAYTMWGPLEVQGPTGATQGYVVLMKQQAPRRSADVALEDLVSGKVQPDTSIERVFVPGIGLVQETLVMGVANLTLLRQVLTLEALPQQHA